LIKKLKNQQQNFKLDILSPKKCNQAPKMRKKYKMLEDRLKTAKER